MTCGLGRESFRLLADRASAPGHSPLYQACDGGRRLSRDGEDGNTVDHGTEVWSPHTVYGP